MLKCAFHYTWLLAALHAAVIFQPLFGQKNSSELSDIGEAALLCNDCALFTSLHCDIRNRGNNSCAGWGSLCNSSKWTLEERGLVVVRPYRRCSIVKEIYAAKNQLISLPRIRAENLEVLHLAYNNLSSLTELEPHLFRSHEVVKHSAFEFTPNLGIIDLGHNHITSVDSNTFAGLTKLKSLIMAGNQIMILPHDVFKNNQLLQGLDLSNNHLSRLPTTVFNNLHMLSVVNLAINQLREIPSTVLSDLEGLLRLDLSRNQLSNIHIHSLANKARAFILLANNPFSCTFALCPLASALLNASSLQTSVEFDFENVMCSYPSYVRGISVVRVFQHWSYRCVTGEACQAYRCDFEQHSRATCQGDVCTCTSPVYSADGLQCICSKGYEQLPNEKCLPGKADLSCKDTFSCRDIDECEMKLHNCSVSEVCVNLPGSFHCNCTRDNCHITVEAEEPGNREGDSTMSTVVLVLAVAGGIAGLLALLCVSFYMFGRCRRRVISRRDSRSPLNVSVTRHNPEYTDHSYVYSVNPHRRIGFNPSYEKADKQNTPRSAVSPAYEVSTISITRSTDSDSFGMARGDQIKAVVSSEPEGSFDRSSSVVSNGKTTRYIRVPISPGGTLKMSTFAAQNPPLQNGDMKHLDNAAVIQPQQGWDINQHTQCNTSNKNGLLESPVNPLQRESTIYDDVVHLPRDAQSRPIATVNPYQHASIHIAGGELQTDQPTEDSELVAKPTAGKPSMQIISQRVDNQVH